MNGSILVTGAAGHIATVVRPMLRTVARQVRLIDRRVVGDRAQNEEVITADLRDLDVVTQAAEGVEAIIHLAGIPDEASFDQILAHNVEPTFNVFEAARAQGVRRVIYASSNHVMGFYPRSELVGAEDPVRPDSYYAVGKIFGEALGRLYHDKWGLEVVCLRIGSFRERPVGLRQRSIWLSYGDAVRLIERSLEADRVGYVVAYGVSANQRSWLSSDEAFRQLGYVPADDAEDHYPQNYQGEADDWSERPRAAEYQGGAFVLPDYSGGLS